MARTPAPEAGPSSAKQRGKAPAHLEEEEEEEEVDHDWDVQSEPAGVRAGSAQAPNVKMPLFTMPDTRYPAKFFFYFRGANKDLRQRLEQVILDHGGMLPFNGRTNKEVWESVQPDIDIFVCDNEGRYDRAKERFRTSNKTRVYLANQIHAWVSDRSFKLYRPVVKNMPGRKPGEFYGRDFTHFTPEDEELMCRFLARWCPDPRDGGRQGRIAYEQMISCYLDWPGATRHSAESWRCYYKTHRATLDPRIEAYVKLDPPREDRLGADPRRRFAMVGMKPKDIMDVDHDSDAAEVEEEIEAIEEEDGEVDMREGSANPYHDHFVQEQGLTPPPVPVSPAKRRRSMEAEQGHGGKRRRQEDQVQAAVPKKVRSRDVSVAGSDAQHPIELEEFEPIAGPSQRPKKKAKKPFVELPAPFMHHYRAPPSPLAPLPDSTQATLVNSPIRRQAAPPQPEDDEVYGDFGAAPELPSILEPPHSAPRRETHRASPLAGSAVGDRLSVDRPRHGRSSRQVSSSPREKKVRGSSEEDSEVDEELYEVGSNNSDWLPGVINSPYQETQDEGHQDDDMVDVEEGLADEEDLLEDDDAAAQPQAQTNQQGTPSVHGQRGSVDRRSLPSPDDVQTIDKVRDARRRSAQSPRAPRESVISDSDDEDSDLEGRFLDNHSRRPSPRYPRLSGLSDRGSPQRHSMPNPAFLAAQTPMRGAPRRTAPVRFEYDSTSEEAYPPEGTLARKVREAQNAKEIFPSPGTKAAEVARRR
ncbi:hypothetical protein PENSPDRAFT_693987 [Peniophora sp. CONT]|nr:hypothetical protein PENSPDRAFT_693987 [Peniophora sp. CONT]